MANFNFVISQNAKCGHAGFYIDRHRMTSSKYAYRKVLFYKKALIVHIGYGFLRVKWPNQ